MYHTRLAFGLLALLVLCCGALAGRDGFSAENLADYRHSHEMTSSFKLLWDGDEEWIHVAMVAETHGWLAIGIAEPTSGRYALNVRKPQKRREQKKV
jgi:hypothetical protein